ncbi:MAG TPA: pirin family protein [Alphaproteobacteria bacterium]|nr:pirin family protein [Alphaproteobacteria bacterium]
MIEHRKFADITQVDFGWLKARHHFSFGRYYDPARMGFGTLRVVNDDRIAAGNGFEKHPHNNMEIITYVREGEVAHADNLGNKGVTRAGNVQVMSAGTGIIHAEHASPTLPTTLYQIWIVPNKAEVKPRWGQADFPTEPATTALPLLVSGTEGEAPLFIHADAKLWGGTLKAGTAFTQNAGPRAYVLASKGTTVVNGHTLEEGDSLALLDEGDLDIKATTDAELVVIGLPK